MANVRGKEIDNTHLSIEQAEARGFYTQGLYRTLFKMDTCSKSIYIYKQDIKQQES